MFLKINYSPFVCLMNNFFIVKTFFIYLFSQIIYKEKLIVSQAVNNILPLKIKLITLSVVDISKTKESYPNSINIISNSISFSSVFILNLETMV